MGGQKTVHGRSIEPVGSPSLNPDERASWRSEKLSSTRKHSSRIWVLAFPVRQYLGGVPTTRKSSASSLVFSFRLISWMAMSSCDSSLQRSEKREKIKITWVRSGNMNSWNSESSFSNAHGIFIGSPALLSAWKDYHPMYVLEIVEKGFTTQSIVIALHQSWG